MARDPVALVHAFNAGREPERLALKYRAMAKDAFAFMRGSCHLFYQDYVAAGLGIDAPTAWICGDLHLENFGSCVGRDRRLHFDMNDFGEALLAPASWELSRFLVSLRVAADNLDIDTAQAGMLSRTFLDAYAAALSGDMAHAMDADRADGMVRDLLHKARARDKADFIDARTHKRNGRLLLHLDGKRALPPQAADRERVAALLEAHAATRSDARCFELLDCARRIAGTGSLGIERHVLLVRGNPSGDDEGPSLLDLRHEPGSALMAYVRQAQPAWTSQAARVVTAQRRMQASPPDLLEALVLGERSYVLKELLPSQDSLELTDWNGKPARLEAVMRAMGATLAGAQLRSAGTPGCAARAELVEFGARMPDMQGRLFEHAEGYARQVDRDWRAFTDAHPVGGQ